MRKKSKGGGEPIETWDGIFADPEVGRVLHANGLIADANKSSIEELATITSLYPGDYYWASYFDKNKVITKFPELKYCTGLSDLRYVFSNCSNLTEVGNIPEGVTDMGSTFRGCSSLISAPIIPEGVTEMRYTFYGCYSLDGIFIIKPINPPTYSLTFSNVKIIYVPDESVDTYKLAEGWSDQSSKIYPMSDMDEHMFFADPEVGRVLHANGLIANAIIASIEELATITTLNPDGGYSTGYFAFNSRITKFPELKYCTGLSSLRYAFPGCSNLTETPIIPEGVTDMCYAFYECSSLIKAPIIPEGVTDMTETFNGCESLDDIFIIKPVTPPTYSLTFFLAANVVAIYVPDESVNTYKNASGWSDYSSKIKRMSELPE